MGPDRLQGAGIPFYVQLGPQKPSHCAVTWSDLFFKSIFLADV